MGGKILKIIFIVLVLSFAYNVFGYNNLITHPILSESAAAIYNQQADNKLTSQELSWIIKGSIDEDNDPRYLNHFYDPITGKGLNGSDQIGNLIFTVQGQSAKVWAKAQNSATGDYSEGAILKNYQNGNLTRAYQGIGHIIHLIQDMSVPAHTRNDPHAGGDPYEKWVEQYTIINPSKLSFLNINSLDQAFDQMANFSNNNFFSKDTILNVDKNIKDNFNVYCVDNLGNKFVCLKYVETPSGVYYKIDDFKVHLNYWGMLYPKAVGYSAGVIDYFIKQFNQIDQIKKEQEQISFLDKLKNYFSWLGSETQYIWGDIFMAQRIFLNSGYDNLLAFIAGSQNNFQNFSDANREIVEQTTNQVGQVLSAVEEAGNTEEIFVPKPANAESAPSMNQNPEASQTVVNIPLEDEQTGSNPITSNQQSPANPIASSTEAAQPITVQPAKPASNFIFISSDGTPPETTITSAPGEMINLSSATFIFTSSESNSTFDCSLNDSGWEICVAPHGLINLSDRGHVFKVRARDASNNVDKTPAEHFWIIDTIAPQITILSGPSDIASSTVANFQFASSESNTIYQCSLDANLLETCSASTTAADLIEGSHSLEITGADLAGNIGSSTIKTWLVDVTAPTSTMASLETSYTATGFSVSWSGSDADATGSTTLTGGLADFDVQYKIDAGDWQDWINATTSVDSIFNLAVENYQTVYFRVRARDLAGNAGEWSAETQTQVIDNHVAGYVVISEIQVGGASANDEFIELYNPADAAIDLSGYSIQYRGGSAQNFYKKNFLAGSIIRPKAYYLIISNEYAGPANADMTHSSFNLSGTGGTIFLVNNYDLLTDNAATGTAVIDRLAYGSGGYLFPEGLAYANAPAAGQSLERKAAATSTSETMSAGGVHAALGNGYDSNDNSTDFILKNISLPQATVNSLEPRPEISSGLAHLWHYDECEGASLNDSVGAENLPQNATRVVGRWQCAINQSWQAQYDIEKTFSAPLPAGEFTFSLYWRSSAWPNEGRNHLYFKTAEGQIAAGIRPSIYTRNLYFNGMSTTSLPAMPNDGDWHMITVVYGSNGLTLYVDAIRKAFYAGDYTIDNQIAGLEMKDENWPVDMDEMAVWSRALGSDEIADIYNANVPLEPYNPPAPPSLAEKIHWWRFDEGAGTTAADSVGGVSLSPIVDWTEGKYNSGIFHTWRNGYEINQDLTPEINSKDLSVDFWWQNSAYPDEGRVSLELQNSAGSKIFGLRPSIYSGAYYFNNSLITFGDLIPRDNLWHHLALVYDSYNFYLYFYVDGVEKIKRPKIWFSRPITKIVIKGENWSYKLDELAIWQGALTAGEVQSIYQSN